MLKYLCFAAALCMATVSHSATLTLSGSSAPGTAVDVSALARSTSDSINPLSTTNSALTDAGIASLTVNDRASGNNERYDAGTRFGAGPAFFNTEAGDLILLEEGTVGIDFGSPTFTISFATLVDGFGFRLADTSSGFVTPIIQAFRNGVEIFSQTGVGTYNATTFFGLADTDGFDQVVISTASGDGYGISALVVGATVGDPNVIPLPATGWLLLAGFGGMAALRRRKKA
ncbi:MAG: VPLPA-CTERM sorting domain-containing protein [Pseudomonadota bacterium]